MQEKTSVFEKETCTRCGGSGNYSWNAVSGSRCFRCHGSGETYTRRGGAARAFFLASLEKPVGEIQVGDSVLASIGMTGTKKWFKVESITIEHQTAKILLTRPSKRYDHALHAPATSTIASVRNEAERLEKLEQAKAYQDTLTKTGKVAKKFTKEAA